MLTLTFQKGNDGTDVSKIILNSKPAAISLTLQPVCNAIKQLSLSMETGESTSLLCRNF